MVNKYVLVKDIFHLMLILVALSLPFYIQLNSFLIASLCVSWIFLICLNKDVITIKKYLFLIVTCGLFFIYVIGAIVSHEKSIALFGLEKRVGLLVFPIILTVLPIKQKVPFRAILIAFIFSTIIIALLAFRKGFDHIFVPHADGLPGIFHYNLLLIHRPYLGMYCSFSVVSLLFLLTNEKNLFKKIIIVLASTFTIVFIFISYSKASLASLFVISLVIGTFYLVQKKEWKYIFMILTLITLITFFLFTKFDIYEKYLSKILNREEFARENHNPGIFHSFSARYGIWECNIDILLKEHNWVWGLGLGDVQNHLNNCFKTNALEINYHEYDKNSTFNAHSEYFQTWLSSGIIGLLILIVNLSIYPFFAFKKNIFYLCFTTLVMVCFFTESMLAVQKGVVFYSFFNSLIAVHSSNRC